MCVSVCACEKDERESNKMFDEVIFLRKSSGKGYMVAWRSLYESPQDLKHIPSAQLNRYWGKFNRNYVCMLAT